jgi:hypothetical protein
MRCSVIVGLIFCTYLMVGCVTSPISISLNGSHEEASACIARVSKSVYDKDEYFHGIASGDSVKEAKNSARSELGLMISSTISVVIDSHKKVIYGQNGESDEEVSNHVQKQMADNVPLDQHQFENIEQCGDLYYASIILKKSNLTRSLNSRLMSITKSIERAVIQANQATPYERYLTKSSLTPLLTQLDSLLSLADRYASSKNKNMGEEWRRKAELFIHNNRDLRIYLRASKKAKPLLAILEKVLLAAELDYGVKQYKNAAIDVFIDSKQTNIRRGELYITNLQSELTVRRTDTDELLAKLPFGQQISTSRISYSTALGHAQKKMDRSIKLKLNGGKTSIRKKLGIL